MHGDAIGGVRVAELGALGVGARGVEALAWSRRRASRSLVMEELVEAAGEGHGRSGKVTRGASAAKPR